MQALSILIALAMAATIAAWIFFLIKPSKYPQKAGQPRSRATISLHLFGLFTLLAVILAIVVPKNTNDTAPAQQAQEQIQLAEATPANEPAGISEAEFQRSENIARFAIDHKQVMQLLKRLDWHDAYAMEAITSGNSDIATMYSAADDAHKKYENAARNPPSFTDFFKADEAQEKLEEAHWALRTLLTANRDVFEAIKQRIDEQDFSPSKMQVIAEQRELAMGLRYAFFENMVNTYKALGVSPAQIDMENGGLIEAKTTQ